MQDIHEHNPRLPRPAEVLTSLGSNAVLLDGIERVDLDTGRAFFAPRAEHFFGVDTRFPILPAVLGMEIFNQFGAYMLMHGRDANEQKQIPMFAGSNKLSWREVVLKGDTVTIHGTVSRHGAHGYSVDGTILKGKDIACKGVVQGILIEPGEEMPEDNYFWPSYPPSSTGINRKTRIPRERKEPRTERSGLYEKLVTLDQIPKREVPKGSPEISVAFEGDNKFVLGDGKLVKLSPSELFIFNALAKNIDRQLSREEIEEMGFGNGLGIGSRQAGFSLAKNHLQKKVVPPGSEQSLVVTTLLKNRKGLYQFDPGVKLVFSDKRTETK